MQYVVVWTSLAMLLLVVIILATLMITALIGTRQGVAPSI